MAVLAKCPKSGRKGPKRKSMYFQLQTSACFTERTAFELLCNIQKKTQYVGRRLYILCEQTQFQCINIQKPINSGNTIYWLHRDWFCCGFSTCFLLQIIAARYFGIFCFSFAPFHLSMKKWFRMIKIEYLNKSNRINWFRFDEMYQKKKLLQNEQ